MSLLLKFAVLLAVIGVSIVGGVSGAYWVLQFREEQVIRPLATVTSVMQGLESIKESVETANHDGTGRSRLAPSTDAASRQVPPFSRTNLADRMRRDLAALEADDWYLSRVGRGTTTNIRARLTECTYLLESGTASLDAADSQRLATLTSDLHDLIERAQRHVLSSTQLTIDFSGDLQQRLLWILGLIVVWGILTGSLALLLVRRWVLRPVANLRAAAARLSQGDFDHRLPVVGRDELSQLAGEVNHMAQMVLTMQEERVDRERLAAVGEMVRRLAHNLRNPLAGIRGLAEVTRADLPRDSDLRENQDRIISAVDRFERWLKDLLGATKPLTVTTEPTELLPMLRGVIESHRPIAQVKGVELVLDVAAAPQVAVFDRRHLEQALVALVANAIDASPPGGVLELAASTDSRSGLLIRVSDQGPGVPLELRDRVFKPYFTTKQGGNGIGLAVVQQVVRAHGGTITIDWSEAAMQTRPKPPAAGPGATFVIRIPSECVTEKAGNPSADGVVGATGGQNSRHRGRSEPQDRHPANPDKILP